jgi:ribosomally synthesized peptide (two-chain TOMM family)
MAENKGDPLFTPAVTGGTADVKVESAGGGQKKLTITWNSATIDQEPQRTLEVLFTPPSGLSNIQDFEIQNASFDLSANEQRNAGASAEATSTDPRQLLIKFFTQTQASGNGNKSRTQANMSSIAYQKADYLHGVEYTEEWRATWLRAVALAWSDTSLQNELMANPAAFFKKYCNYNLPPTVDLVVVDPSTLNTDPQCGFSPGSGSGYDWTWQLPRSVLLMFLPPKPADIKQQAIALAAYEAVGKQYPFTVTS